MSNFPFIVNLKKPACAFRQDGLVVFTILHVFLQEHLLFCIYQDDKHLGANRSTYIRVGKTGSMGPWSRVIVYCSKLSFCQNDSPIGGTLFGCLVFNGVVYIVFEGGKISKGILIFLPSSHMNEIF